MCPKLLLIAVAHLVNLVRGKALVKLLAEEHLRDMATDASARLRSLAGQGYAPETAARATLLSVTTTTEDRGAP